MEEIIFKAIFPEEVYSIPAPVTVLVTTPWEKIDHANRELLGKILKAVGQAPESVRIVHQTKFDLSAWVEKPAYGIAFMPPPADLTSYEVIQTDQTKVIFADPLEMLASNEGAKRRLWDALKTMFPG